MWRSASFDTKGVAVLTGNVEGGRRKRGLPRRSYTATDRAA